MSNLPDFVEHHPGVYFAVLVAMTLIVEWASRQFGRVREVSEP